MGPAGWVFTLLPAETQTDTFQNYCTWQYADKSLFDMNWFLLDICCFEFANVDGLWFHSVEWKSIPKLKGQLKLQLMLLYEYAYTGFVGYNFTMINLLYLLHLLHLRLWCEI